MNDILKRVVESGKVGHAYIFEGMNGVDKLAAALEFAAEICGDAELQAAMDNGQWTMDNDRDILRNSQNPILSHPDIRIITNELYDSTKAEKIQISVDTVRKMKAEIYVKPYRAERKVYIVPNADSISVMSAFIAAQNAMLKVFEEPPSYCTIILLAENSNTFLPTILSRAVVVKFSPLDKDAHLRYLLEDEGMAALREDILKYMSALDGGGYPAAYELIAFAKKNKKNSGAILEIIGLYLQERLSGENTRQASPATLFTKEGLLKTAGMLDIYLKYSKMIAANGNYAACMECMVLGFSDCV